MQEQTRIEETQKQELERRGQERVKEIIGKDKLERKVQTVKVKKPKKNKVVGKAEDKEGQKEEVWEEEEEERRRVETCWQLERKGGASIGRMRGAARAVRRSGAGATAGEAGEGAGEREQDSG